MDQPRHLLAKRLHQTRMVVAEGIDRHARHSVQIALALLVDDMAALAADKRDRQPAIGIHQMRHGALRNAGRLLPAQKRTAARHCQGRRFNSQRYLNKRRGESHGVAWQLGKILKR